MQIAQTAQEEVVAYTIGMVPPTTTQDDDGKVIDATGLFGAPTQQSSPSDRPDEPEIYAPRQVASQLLVPGGEPLTGKPPEPDDYFTDLIERQGETGAADAKGPRRPGRPSDHDELDLFFETAAMQAPTPSSLAPTAPGSATLDESAVLPRRATKLHLTPPRIASVIAASLVGVALVLSTLLHSDSSRTRRNASDGLQASVPFLSGFASQTQRAASRMFTVSLHRPAKPRVGRRRRHPRAHHHASTSATTGPHRTILASTAAVSSTARSSSVSQPSTATTTGSASSAPAATESTQPTSTHKSPTTTTSRPAFGQAGTLGPGHSPDS
jgi:hypothetical protein